MTLEFGVIDARVRPPYGSFTDLANFPKERVQDPPLPAAGRGLPRYGATDDRSVYEKSMSCLVEEMETAGVSSAVVHGRRASGKFGAVDNDDVISLVKERAGTFSGLLGADLTDFRVCLVDIERAAGIEGIQGMTFDPGWQDPAMPLDDRKLYPLYEACQDLGLTIIVVSSILAGPTLSFADPARVERIALAFPRARIGVVHGCFPYVNEALGLLFQCPNVWLIPDFYHFVPGMPGASDWTEACATVGRRRIVYASSYPIRPIGQSVEQFLATGVNESSLADVMSNNARELFSISNQQQL